MFAMTVTSPRRGICFVFQKASKKKNLSAAGLLTAKIAVWEWQIKLTL